MVFRIILASLFCGLWFTPATPQTAPGASEIAAFSPLFAAAHSGTAEDVRAALADGARVTETDHRQRLATHIAAFASNDEALRALAEAGADMNACLMTLPVSMRRWSLCPTRHLWRAEAVCGSGDAWS